MRTPIAFLIVATLTNVIRCETEVVQIFSANRYNQLVTSSILRWVFMEPGDKFPDNPVIGAVHRDGGTAKAYVCRASIEGVWETGEVRPEDGKSCVVSMHGIVHKKERYQILDNLENGARLSWMDWSKYLQLPKGMVAADKNIYIGRVVAPRNANNYSHQVGSLDTSTGMGKIKVVSEDGITVTDHEIGQILIETEPVSYHVTGIKFNKFRIRVSKTKMHLGHARMVNEDQPDNPMEEMSRVDTVISYKYNYSLSWGHGHAIITGSPVQIRLKNGTDMGTFNWAIDITEEKQNLFQVETFLAPGTGVNVTLVANFTEMNIPYSGSLTAFYADGEKRTRNLESSKREILMLDVQPKFGPVYFLNNNSFVPTTTTTTTTTTSTTTSKTTSSSTSESPAPIPPSPIERSTKKTVTDPVKGENSSSMQRDEGRVAESATASSASSISAGCLLVTYLFTTARRIT